MHAQIEKIRKLTYAEFYSEYTGQPNPEPIPPADPFMG
jgi:hypothetical protein